MRKRAAASSGRQDAESGGGGMERRGKDGFLGVGARCGRRRKSGGGGGRKEGRKEEELLLVHCCCCCARPPPPKKTTVAGCSADRPSKPQKGRTPPKWVLLQCRDSPFTHPSFLPFFSPRWGVPHLHPGYKRLCGSLQHFFLLREKGGYERASLMLPPLAPILPCERRKGIAGKVKSHAKPFIGSTDTLKNIRSAGESSFFN